MKKNLLFGIMLSLVVSVSAQAREFLVKYKPLAYTQLLSMYGMNIKDTNHEGQYIKVNIPDNIEAKVISDLFGSGNVETVVPNYKLYALRAPYTTQTLKQQWHIAKVSADKAWAKAGNKGSSKVRVAVIDTGVDYNHEALKSNMESGYDFHTDKPDPMDVTSQDNPGHGTHCAGIVGATGVIEGGTIGISPEVTIIPIRFIGEDGSGDLNNAIKAIDFAISKKVDVISASWGAPTTRSQAQLLLEAIKRADDKGIIFVAAASNDGENNDKVEMYPANAGFTNTISVAASNSKDEKPYWSNYGKATVHLAAPGEEIMSTIPKNGYKNLSGTSMATPLVSGLVALMKAQDQSLTGTQIKAILQSTGAKVKIETQCNCRVDALKAIEVILDKKMYIAPVAGTYALNSKVSFDAFNTNGNVIWNSSNDKVLKISSSGQAEAISKGEAVISATDEKGNKVESLTIYVGKGASGPINEPGPGEPTDPNQPAPQPGECPLGDPELCKFLCMVQPDAPFCK